MGKIIDSCIWIDYLRKSTPESVRRVADLHINDAEAMICEPIQFELMAGASKRDRPVLISLLETMPMIPTPTNLWLEASRLSTLLTDSGTRMTSMDLLIASLCLIKGVTLVTFDQHFKEIASHSELDLILIKRPIAT